MPDFVETYDDALKPRWCRALIEAFESNPHVGPGHLGHGVDPHRKDSLDLAISTHPEFAAFCTVIEAAIMMHLVQYIDRYRFALLGHLSPQIIDPDTGDRVLITPENFDRWATPRLEDLIRRLYRLTTFNMQKYPRDRGGYHQWHSEIHPLDPLGETLHRFLLFQFYLNDIDDGGETEFFYQQQRIAPRTGRLLIAPAGFTHTHKGHVPRSADKYILTSWVSFQRAEWLFGSPR